jgi:DNA-binding CsgD family transcriptional regulator
MATPNFRPPIDLTPPYIELIESGRFMIPLLNQPPDSDEIEVSRDTMLELLPLAQGLKATERAIELSGLDPTKTKTQHKTYVDNKRRQLIRNWGTENAPHTVRTAFEHGVLGVLATDLAQEHARPTLTDAELRALGLLSLGVSTEEIGFLLHQRRNPHRITRPLFGKLGVRNAPAAVSMAYVYKLPGFTDASEARAR